MSAYYNEIDPYAAAWLRNLIAAGHIAPGDVDERSIVDVPADDLSGYTQCHFFAGIGGWSLALRLAGWPDDQPVWTGSCPCQPFSVAGRGGGKADDRHLWPAWFGLISECRPAVIFGEQVEGAVKHGWLDLVSGDLEGEDYAFGAAVLGAHSVGAPHIRQRLYFGAARVADTDNARLEGCDEGTLGDKRPTAQRDSGSGGMADSDRGKRVGLADGQGHWRYVAARGWRQGDGELAAGGELCWPGSPYSFWRDADWLGCRDGKWRPVEPGTFPLAHGIPGRVGRLRAYGNAICPQTAATFIQNFRI